MTLPIPIPRTSSSGHLGSHNNSSNNQHHNSNNSNIYNDEDAMMKKIGLDLGMSVDDEPSDVVGAAGDDDGQGMVMANSADDDNVTTMERIDDLTYGQSEDGVATR